MKLCTVCTDTFHVSGRFQSVQKVLCFHEKFTRRAAKNFKFFQKLRIFVLIPGNDLEQGKETVQKRYKQYKTGKKHPKRAVKTQARDLRTATNQAKTCRIQFVLFVETLSNVYHW
jgi:hypothetical protein